MSKRRYNANGGQRRSRTFRLHIPQTQFSRLMVELIKISERDGADIADGVLKKLAEKYDIKPQEESFIRSLLHTEGK